MIVILCFFTVSCGEKDVFSVEKFNAKMSSLKNYPNLKLVSSDKRENFYTHRLKVSGMDSRDAQDYKKAFPEDVIFFSGDGAGETVATIYTNYPKKRVIYLKEGT